MKRFLFTLLTTSIICGACKKDEKIIADPIITSSALHDDLLFVNKHDFQITASEAATYSSSDPSITISKSGLISRVTSGEIVIVNVSWTRTGKTEKLHVLGSTDNEHVNPFEKFRGATSDNPDGQYIKGWATLRKLAESGQTYFIVLRHADASLGMDYSLGHQDPVIPANWWKSCDTALARQLNPQGKVRATELGVVFKDLKMPITRVISSEFCRALTTAQLINSGPSISIDKRINHPEYLKTGETLFQGLQHIISETPVDNKITLISTHHPINEFNDSGIASFPKVSVYNWTAAYFVKVNADKTFTYEGAASFGMFKYWRDLKLNKI
ncbi:histidine phosphatase family protein [Arcticibacter eurypsychrophilus]|uniref:histidine phosphatase family protein n=1 Tax=Arcticibacter eurypsychrophilus TaxID=1434752 RepID=UPI0014817ACD|nr:histidine phosphatase family protein [Arcticibacter eurypsychrophilus]